MKTQYTFLLIGSFVALASQNILAADATHGKELHDATCQSCHASLMPGNPSDIYTRSDHKVTSLGGLKSQVTRCKDSVGAAWFDDDVADVVSYLNNNFYKFK